MNSGLLSWLVSLLLFFAFQAFLIHSAKQKDASITFWDLVVTGDDKKYSLSRFQIYLWFVTVITSYTAFFFVTGKFAIVPENLGILIGINATAAVASTAISLSKGTPSPASAGPTQQQNTGIQGNAIGPTPPSFPVGPPDFLRNIFLDSNNILDFPRTQMFIWTIVILSMFIWQSLQLLINSGPNNTGLTLPDIPTGLLVLMGVSHGTYLGTKAAGN